jgi:3-methyladenine DNA glycosylase/8-oxoguanine DNA glycosylase
MTSEPIDLRLSLAPLWRGHGDPTMRMGREIWRASRTRSGPVAIRIAGRSAGVEVEAWGPGADEALDRASAIVGLDDDPRMFRPAHRLLARLHRLAPGLRLPRTGALVEVLLPAILEQKITGTEAHRAWRSLVVRYGEPAPGPLGLRLPPDPAVLARLPYYAFHPLGVERRRAEVIRRLAARAAELEALVDGSPEAARSRLMAFPGIGPWTAAEVTLRAMGDPDAVSVGDFHLPHLVSWALAGEPRGDDTRMLELLEPFRGQRGRAIRLLETSGIRAPRFGPPMSPRSIAAI